MRNLWSVDAPPEGLALVAIVVGRLGNHDYSGGVNGTCFDCPFSSVPLRRDGSIAEWQEISNDPTEAYFRCRLPGRDDANVAWGEYAPCTEDEWRSAALAEIPGEVEAGETSS